jgi:hypothetical protein
MNVMNPLKPFDYVYYSIVYLFSREWMYGWPPSPGVGIMFLGMFQYFNFMFLASLFLPPTHFNFDTIYAYITGLIVFIALNTLRYKRFVNYNDLETKWGNEIGIRRILKIIAVIVYCVASYILPGMKL